MLIPIFPFTLSLYPLSFFLSHSVEVVWSFGWTVVRSVGRLVAVVVCLLPSVRNVCLCLHHHLLWWERTVLVSYCGTSANMRVKLNFNALALSFSHLLVPSFSLLSFLLSIFFFSIWFCFTFLILLILHATSTTTNWLLSSTPQPTNRHICIHNPIQMCEGGRVWYGLCVNQIASTLAVDKQRFLSILLHSRCSWATSITVSLPPTPTTKTSRR